MTKYFNFGREITEHPSCSEFSLLLARACWHSPLRNRRMREHCWQKWRELMRLANELTHFHAHHPRIHSKRWRETNNIELMIHSNIQNAMLLTRLLWYHKLGRREGGKRTRRCHNSGTESQGRREGGKKSRRCTNSGTESDSHKQYSLQMTSCCDTVQVFFLGGVVSSSAVDAALESIFRPQRADKLQRRKPRLRIIRWSFGVSAGLWLSTQCSALKDTHFISVWPTYQRKFRLRNFRYTNNISVKLSQVEQVK